MSDSYLNLARRILEIRGRPMTAQNILRDAVRHGLLPEHLYGATMTKTLQARIAEDIFVNRNSSAFYRTGIGRYFLRDLAADPTLPAEALRERGRSPRAKSAPSARVLCLTSPRTADVNGTNKGLHWLGPKSVGGKLLSPSSYYYLGQEPVDLLHVLTMTVVSRGEEILCHTVGRHTLFVDLLGTVSVGFRRYVDEFDFDLFASSYSQPAFELNAARETLRHLNAVPPLSDSQIRSTMALAGGVLDLRKRQFWVVITAKIEHSKPRTVRRLGINRPQWISKFQIDTEKLDEVSRIVLRKMSAP